MATIDLSRSASDFRKHYKSVRAQQGRVFVDDDYNENERLHGEDDRRARVDIIGPAGTPDSGFLISNPRVTAGKIDFDIAAGTFYLGGLHLESDQNERFQVQSDWLQFSGATLPGPPTTGKRFDLVYLESWLQPVSAVEDSELFEVALGGPDTSTRMRVMRRVRIATGTATGDCRQDWKTLVDSWKAKGLGTLNNQDELVPDTRLKVEFDTGTNPADLCSPPVAGGYLGAENQAIRVQLTDAGHFTWGFDNAAPLYRVRVSNNGGGQPRIITMMTEPKDQAHWPLSGQVVELLPWSTVLPNNEKLAERGGLLTRVASSYNPDTKQLSVASNVPLTFGAGWKTRPDAVQLGSEFYYMRVWNRGQDTTSPLEIPVGTGVSLGQTGLKITISGADRQDNDHWIIAARPESPNRVVPWVLETGRSPHGYRRFYAPLAVIEWTVSGGEAIGKIDHDCRETFPPLTRLRSCCTYTVGDGVNSFGTFTRIQEAIDHLPANGGEVCILPGIYEENTVIINRRNITVHGCGRRTILRTAGNSTNPVIRIQDSQRIVIKSLAIEAPAVIGVKLIGTPAAEQKAVGLKWIDLDHLEIAARDESAIDCRGGRFIRIERNDIQVGQLARTLLANSNAGKSAAVFVGADDVRIELNRIETNIERRSFSALGGIQLGGGSERVEVRRNQIIGGNGNGITLGSFTYILAVNQNLLLVQFQNAFVGSVQAFPGASLFIGDDDCPHPDPDPKDPKDPAGNPLIPVSDGDLTDIRIVDNDMSLMGLNGIATQRISMKARGWPITVRVLDIEWNRIFSCMQIRLGNAPFSANFPYGYGGISLIACEYLTVRDNRIKKNGVSFIDPICGVFVFRGAGLIFEQNEIVDNGVIAVVQSLPTPGPRGGIVIEETRTPMVAVESIVDPATGVKSSGFPHDGFPALRVTDNVVISPMGPALQVLARGFVEVADNQLTSHGVETRNAAAADSSPLAALAAWGGVTVRILNLGISYEIVDMFTGMQSVQNSPAAGNTDTSATTTNVSIDAGLVGGKVLFNDNQVFLSLRGREDAVIVSSVLLISMDDVSKHGNQCECRIGIRPLLTNAFVLAWSARVADNRYQERLVFSNREQQSTGFSAVTMASMNSTTDNQGTRCFSVTGFYETLRINAPNRSLVEQSGRSRCRQFGGVTGSAEPGSVFNERTT